MKSKWIYLFLAFLLPIGLTFFLQFFGKSEFNIPVYYEKGISNDSLPACHYQYQAPYRVADSIINQYSKEKGAPLLISIDSGTLTAKNFARVKEELGEGQYTFVAIRSGENDPLLSCVLFLNKPWTTVLVDGQKQIRGYYNPATREEADRLIAEMKILLKDY